MDVTTMPVPAPLGFCANCLISGVGNDAVTTRNGTALCHHCNAAAVRAHEEVAEALQSVQMPRMPEIRRPI